MVEWWEPPRRTTERISVTQQLAFVDHIATESALFRAALADTASDAPVPTCPGWSAADLLSHLTEVQWFWGEIVQRETPPDVQIDDIEDAKPAWPSKHKAALAAFDEAHARLVAVLRATPDDAPRWMWSDDQTAGYIKRRQAQEALMHRVDAEVAAGRRTPIDPWLAADGVDEALRTMRGHVPEEGWIHEPVAEPVTISAIDTMHSWSVHPHRVRGRLGDRDIDTLAFLVTDGPGQSAAATIVGEAGDLDCWLWNRPVLHEIVRSGDPDALAAVDGVLANDID